MSAGIKDILNPEVFNRIENLELRARKIMEGLLSGIHRSPYLGNSVEFASHREYVPGDEIKRLDWKVWGRSDKLFVKQYEEETNLDCHIVIDSSNSMVYNGLSQNSISKFQYASTIAAVLMLLMNKQSDSISLTIFDNEIRENFSSSSHPNQVRFLIHQLNKINPSNQTNIKMPLNYLAEKFNKKGVIILISDLFVSIDNFQNALKHFRYCGHDVIIFQIMHEDELQFPFNENIRFEGLELAEHAQVDALSLKKAYLEVLKEFNDKVLKICASYDYDHLLISTGDSLGAILSSYLNFRRRIRSMR